MQLKQLENSENNTMANTQTTAECQCRKLVPLTDEEIKMMIPDGQEWKYGVGFSEAIEFARAIEAAHNIKGEA